MNRNEIMKKLMSDSEKLNDLLEIACDLSSNENTHTAFTHKVAMCMSNVIDTIGSIIDLLEKKERRFVTYEEPLAGRFFTLRQMREVYRDMADKEEYANFDIWLDDMLRSGVFEEIF